MPKEFPARQCGDRSSPFYKDQLEAPANPPHGSAGIVQVLSTNSDLVERCKSPKRQFGDRSSPFYCLAPKN